MDLKDYSRLVDEARCEFLLYRIFSGKIEYNDTYIKDPDWRIKKLGAKIYYQTIKSCKDVTSERDIYLFMVETNQWSKAEQAKLDSFPRQIENLKVAYYSGYQNPTQRKKNKQILETAKNDYQDLFLKRNIYKNLTAEGVARGAMWFEMIHYMYKGTDYLKALNYYQRNSIEENDLRTISQSGEWMSYYSSGKNIFGKPMFFLTDYQRKLITWSNVYKNTRSSPDSPSEEIFYDHDAFDGYLIHQNRKDKTEKKDSAMKVPQNASNVFMFTGIEKQDIDEIKSYNTPEALEKIEKQFRDSNEQQQQQKQN